MNDIATGSKFKYNIITGYIRDYATPLLIEESVAIRTKLELHGAKKIVFVVDPAVRLLANIIFPAPEIELTVSVAATLYVPFPPTITSVPDARDPETDNVPSVILVSPVYVFVPESVNVPEPECVKLPAPDITPLRVTFDEPLLFKVLEFKSMLPSTDNVDAVIFESILRSPSVETVNPPPAVIPPEPIVKSPAVVDVPEATIVKLPFPVALECPLVFVAIVPLVQEDPPPPPAA